VFLSPQSLTRKKKKNYLKKNLLGPQDRTPAHDWRATEAAIIDSLGGPEQWASGFVGFEPLPMASGSVAQVHLVHRIGASPVCVKVVHPDAAERFDADVAIILAAARAIEAVVPSARWFAPAEAMERFRQSLHAQLDMRSEARNLDRFNTNWAQWPRALRECVVFPQRVGGIAAAPGILWMTKVPGRPLHAALRARGGSDDHDVVSPASRKRLAAAGLDAFLQMLVSDSFVHADLHPGNILISSGGGSGSSGGGSGSSGGGGGDAGGDRLSLVDCGLVCELGPQDHANFVDLLGAVAEGDCEAAADMMISRARAHACRDVPAFRAEMAAALGGAMDRPLAEIRVAEILSRIVGTVRRHRVLLEPNFATMVLAVAIIEGVGREMDPELRLTDRVIPIIRRERLGF
jgi:predicted unusual protein kinase regulating ubiquinone biosynthesis (AarF/ABC1/UbiB family)